MRALALAVVLAAAACSGGGSVTAVYGGAANWAAIEAPEKVTTYRVIRPGVLQHVRAPETIAGFEIVAGPIDVDAATAKELAAIFADDETYEFETAKACEFDPGVALRFARAGTVVDVLLCFSCDELAAYEGKKRVGGEDFDTARPRLVAIVKRLFPEDEKLQALK
jgi:hypothetical protein